MPYTQTSLTSGTDQLAVALRDPQHSYWSLLEKQNAIIEALRIFQSLTGYYRERTVFNTSTSVAFYDLRTLIPAQYAFTITDDDLLGEIEAHFLEPVSNPWTGTDQFSITAIQSSMENIRDNFLLETGIYITRTTPGGVPPPTGRIQLNQSIIDIRRAAWQDSSTLKTYALHRTDEYAGGAYSPSWLQTPALPYQYSVALTPPVSLQLIPAPSNAGTLDLCTTNSGPTLNLNPSVPVILGVPDDLCWAVKYGTMAELLSSDGDARDPQRAKLCDDLYRLGISVANEPVTSLQVLVNDVLVPISSIDDLDKYQTEWQHTMGVPSQAAMVGANLLVLCGDSNSGTGVPDSNGPYSITVDLARSFPIPDVNNPGTTYLQVGLELLDPILDMAQHICSFKMSGQEYLATMELRNGFLRACGSVNRRLRSNAFYNLLLSQPASRQDYQIPRMTPREAQTA